MGIPLDVENVSIHNYNGILTEAGSSMRYLTCKNKECEALTGYPDYVAEYEMKHGLRKPKMPFYSMGGCMWDNPFASPYPSLYQVINILTAGKCDIKIVGYSTLRKKIVDMATFFWDEHVILDATIEDALSQTIGAPDARVYKIEIKRHLFRRPTAIVYLSTDDPIMYDDGMDGSGFHTYPNPEEMGYHL